MLGEHVSAHTWVFTMERRNSKRATLFMCEKSRQILVRAQTEWTFVSLRNGRPLPTPEEVGSAFKIITEAQALRETGL